MACAVTRANDDIGCCISILMAPLCASPAISRMATNGSRKTAATSHALKVGAQMPTSGENASPTPSAVPFNPLASAYVRTALMNVTPTSGPIARSSTHNARDATSSRYSFLSNHTYGRPAPPADARLGERKEHLFEVVVLNRRSGACRGEPRQFRERAFAARAPAAEQHEAVADARGVTNLVDRQEQRATGRRVRT